MCIERKWKSLSHVQFFATPCNTQSMEFSRPEYWSGYPILSSQPRDLSNPGIETRSPTLQVDFLPAESPGKPKNRKNGYREDGNSFKGKKGRWHQRPGLSTRWWMGIWNQRRWGAGKSIFTGFIFNYLFASVNLKIVFCTEAVLDSW